MKNITVKINKRNLNALVRKTKFNYGGMFTSYGFIAIDFKTDRNNTAIFYETSIVSRNSWTNYPGFQIWNNRNTAKCKKKNVIADIEETIEDVIRDLGYSFPDVNFELIGW